MTDYKRLCSAVLGIYRVLITSPINCIPHEQYVQINATMVGELCYSERAQSTMESMHNLLTIFLGNVISETGQA